MAEMLRYTRFLLLNCWIAFVCPTLVKEDKTLKLDVDKFITNYINEVRRTLRLDQENHKINKRSYPEMDLSQLQGLDLLVGFQEEFSMPSTFPNDLVLFSQCPSDHQDEHIWFAAALEANKKDPQKSLANDMVLFRFQEGVWIEIHREPVLGGVRLATEQIGDTIYIIVAEYYADNLRGSTVFQVNSTTNTLQFVHMLNTHFPSDIVMWKWEDMDAFVAVAISENGEGSEKRYSTQSPVYRLLGSHFDMICTLPTYNPRALTQFNIRSSMFIAFANFQNDLGETVVDSDIFRYDVAKNKFTLYQKLPTEAAVDIKYFCFQGYQVTESFLIYASAFHTDEEGNRDYNAASIIYKLSDEEYFVPFQALHVYKISSWLPVRSLKENRESLILLAATEEGIVSYQYDGWRFVLTGVQNDESTFGPGPKSFNVFYNANQTFISVANKESKGYEACIFSPKLEPHTDAISVVEKLQKFMLEWVQRTSDELAEGEARLETLLKIAQMAPSVDDSVIELGSDVVFYDAEIDHIQTYLTKVKEDDTSDEAIKQLSLLNNNLDRVKEDLIALRYKVDQLSVHTRTVYEVTEEHSADITCHGKYCDVQHLEVEHINGEDLTEFLANTVNIKEPVTFYNEIVFEHLALIDPLDTKLINGHPVETLVDWSEKVVLDKGLKVEGDLILEKDLFVTGTLGGISLIDEQEYNLDTEEEAYELPTNYIKTLNASQLFLDDGMLSGVNFKEFSESTLKTQGDQIITEFIEFEKLTVDEDISEDKLQSDPFTPDIVQSSPCENESCKQDEGPLISQQTIMSAKSAEDGNEIESIKLSDEIIITRDFVISGTVTVQDGSLSAKNLLDLKHHISTSKVLEFGIRLDEPVIDTHFEFSGGFKAASLTVDSLNGVDLSTLVEFEGLDSVVVKGRKEFRGDVVVEGRTEVTGTVNGINLSQSDPTAFREMKLDNLTVLRISSSNITLDGNYWQNMVRKRDDNWIYLNNLQVEGNVTVNNLTLKGQINEFNLEKLIQDTVFKDGKVYDITGKKQFVNGVKMSNLTVETLNGNEMSALTPEFVWKKRLTQSKTIQVESLYYKGDLDGIPSSDFGEWLLTEGDQTIMGSQTIDSLQADSVMVPNDGKFNSLNIHRLINEAIFVTGNVTLGHFVFEGEVQIPQLTVGRRLNGLIVPADVVVSGSALIQQVTAAKRVLGNITVQGSVDPPDNLSNFCKALSQNYSHLVVEGNATFSEEPNISQSVNNKTWSDLMERVWFKEENIKITKPALLFAAKFNNLEVKNINNHEVEESISKIVSLSQDQTINGSFYFNNVTMNNGLEARDAKVEGKLQGVHLQSFVQTVLLDGVDQEIWGIPDFDYLIVDGVLDSEGFVNQLNLSSDVMLINVDNNTVTGSLTLNHLITVDLKLPPGATVAGVDLTSWQHTAVNKSADNVITGNLVFMGQYDSAKGISVDGLVNGVSFDTKHMLMKTGDQEIAGFKKFSSHSKLNISELHVMGFLNDINVTYFYDQQVSRAGNTTISGHKKFLSALYAERALLPEMYLGHNLTWLDSQLSWPLPWAQYNNQLTLVHEMKQLALTSLAGRAYYLKNMKRVSDLEGHVLFASPLRTNDSTVVAAVRLDNNNITLSLLHWDNKYSMFLDKPGTRRYFVNTIPSEVQSVSLPGGELATYVTSIHPINDSTQSAHYGELFRVKNYRIHSTRVFGGRSGSKLLSFQDYRSRTCFIVLSDDCRGYCQTQSGQKVRLPLFSCRNITEITLLTTTQSVYAFGLRSEGSQHALVVWRLSSKRFIQVQSVAQFNPVSIAATITTGPLVAVASRHCTGNSQPETIQIYRLVEESSELLLEQSLPTISPKKVLLASLPSAESVMYVASDNPATPLEVFVYRGILGYQLLMVDATLPIPSDVYAFTDHQQRHFVVVTSQSKGHVLEAEFKGNL